MAISNIETLEVATAIKDHVENEINELTTRDDKIVRIKYIITTGAYIGISIVVALISKGLVVAGSPFVVGGLIIIGGLLAIGGYITGSKDRKKNMVKMLSFVDKILSKMHENEVKTTNEISSHRVKVSEVEKAIEEVRTVTSSRGFTPRMMPRQLNRIPIDERRYKQGVVYYDVKNDEYVFERIDAETPRNYDDEFSTGYDFTKSKSGDHIYINEPKC